MCDVVAVVVVSVVLGNIQIEKAVNHFLSSYQKQLQQNGSRSFRYTSLRYEVSSVAAQKFRSFRV